MANKRIDDATGAETVGHEWDGIEELNNPLPRWWATFYATILWAIGYMVVYPAIPMLSKGTEGLWGWLSRGQLAQEMKAESARQAPIMAALANIPIEQLPQGRARMAQAIAGGKAAFKVNCVQCHGAGAAGSPGFPNLADDDWLWGGDLKTIETTLTHGIRHPGDDQTRNSAMPAFGRDALLTPAQIGDVVSYVRTLSGKEKPGAPSQRGATVFAEQCTICHGPAGKGDRKLGAPNLTDAIWLYGGSRAAIQNQVTNAAHGVMPAWGGKLDPVTIKMLAAMSSLAGRGRRLRGGRRKPGGKGK